MAKGIGTPRQTPSGKWQFRKSYKKQSWVSKSFDSCARANERLALADFKEFCKTIDEDERLQRITSDPRIEQLEVVLAELKGYARLVNHGELEELVSVVQRKNISGQEAHEFVSSMDDGLRAMMRYNVEMKRENTPVDTSLQASHLIADYLSELKPKSSKWWKAKSALKRFSECFGDDRSITELDETEVRKFYKHLNNSGLSQNSAAPYQTEFVAFVEAVKEDYPDDIPDVANLKSKRTKIKEQHGEPNPFTIKEAKLFLKNSDERTELYFLLMLNCCMYQGDVSELTADQVDWEAGRIIRTRNKKKKAAETKGKKVPSKTNWKLWVRTFELLKKYGNREGVVLVHENGMPVVNQQTRMDYVAVEFNKIRDNLIASAELSEDFSKSCKCFRKTTVEICDNSDEHDGVINEILEHSVAKQHYLTSGKVKPHLDAAIEYAGKKLGVV